ncbi:hypothetical protein NLI96_g2681 [Meripilus lineatus]|uniref:J domain-containing protein n=1 Tax=Meripilus lineatus TaxID=2056292 RepID=A0AAD5VAB0_9APHY|nr:hypothetical protein NLI96_g2681 [Physisporinus lineatus]
MAPVETEYYDLLDVPTDVNETDLKKAYRKQAIKYHPDKNPSPEAEEKFKDISKAYQVLSDPNLRAVYDRNGAKMVDKEGGISMDDAAGFFANVFGGERFKDYVSYSHLPHSFTFSIHPLPINPQIGEISLMKEMTSVASTMMTEEERTELEKELNPNANANGGSVTASGTATPAAQPQASSASASPPSSPSPEQSAPGATATATVPDPEKLSAGQSLVPAPSPSPTPDSKSTSSAGASGSKDVSSGSASGTETPTKKAASKRANKLSPEQKRKLAELDEERRKNMEARVEELKKKLIERIRPFVEAHKPGDKDDAETKAFEGKMKREADDLKLESFGVELLHTIGNVYMMKATSFLKSRKFLGIPGFFSRLKEKGAVAKDAWGVLGSAIGVQQTMIEMEKLQSKPEVAEEELRAIEEDVTSKILLASWRGTRFEVVQVLREVVDAVLKDHSVEEQVLVNRAKALLLMGAVFKATTPDESDAERRELEKMVAEAAAGKSKLQQLHAEARAAAKLQAKQQRHAKQAIPSASQASHSH